SSTHHQDDDDEQESHELEASLCPASPEPWSPQRHAFYFDCKLCLKMAREPVVTSCGHLYCGDCLDKWLHFFTSQMKCPVCHSKVLGSSIIPIKADTGSMQQRPGLWLKFVIKTKWGTLL
ncbi:unnamed protein product, partial [Prunus brigantina]